MWPDNFSDQDLNVCAELKKYTTAVCLYVILDLMLPISRINYFGGDSRLDQWTFKF